MNDIFYAVSTVDSPDGRGLHVEPGLGGKWDRGSAWKAKNNKIIKLDKRGLGTERVESKLQNNNKIS